MIIALPDTGPIPVQRTAEPAIVEHPSWCDPRTCVVAPNYAPGLTNYVHSLVVLDETIPPTQNTSGAGTRIVVEVEQGDLRRDSDAAIVDDWGNPTELGPPYVWVTGLHLVDLTAEQARRVAAAVAQASAVVARAAAG